MSTGRSGATTFHSLPPPRLATYGPLLRAAGAGAGAAPLIPSKPGAPLVPTAAGTQPLMPTPASQPLVPTPAAPLVPTTAPAPLSATPMMPQASAPTVAGVSGAAWWCLCVQNEGIMLPGPQLQLGFKSEFRGHRGKIGIYYGNLSPQTINLSCSITADDALKLSAPDRAGEPPSTLPPRGQALQMVQTECTGPFTDAPLVTLSFSQEGGAKQNVSLRLPIPPLRFLQPSAMTGDEYFKVWRTAGLAESQSSFHFTGQYDPNTVRRVLSEAFHLAVLNGVDPVQTNFVASGSCALRGTGTGANATASGSPCLLRLEVNPNYARAGGGPPKAAARLTVRSERGVASSIVNALAALWGGVTPP